MLTNYLKNRTKGSKITSRFELVVAYDDERSNRRPPDAKYGRAGTFREA